MDTAPAEDRPSYVPFYEGLFDAMDCLDDADVVQLIHIIKDYAFDGVVPEGKGAAQAVFCTVRPAIDKSTERLRAKRRAGRTSASKRQQVEAEPPVLEQTPTENVLLEQNATETIVLEQTSTQSDVLEQNATDGVLLTQAKAKAEANTKAKANAYAKNPKSTGAQSARARAKFTPPSLDEARDYAEAYCRGKGIPPGVFSADEFWNHYESVGWKVGRNPMKSWQASVRSWIARRIARDNPGGGGGGFSDATRAAERSAKLVSSF